MGFLERRKAERGLLVGFRRNYGTVLWFFLIEPLSENITMDQTMFQVLGMYMENKTGRVPPLKFTFQFGIEGVE